jgi:hypothetical protein
LKLLPAYCPSLEQLRITYCCDRMNTIEQIEMENCLREAGKEGRWINMKLVEIRSYKQVSSRNQMYTPNIQIWPR